jgi:ribosome biogenesis protein Nip4
MVQWDIVRNQIDSDFGAGVTKRLLGNLMPVSLPRAKGSSFYLVPSGWLQILDRDFKSFTPLSLGMWLGDLVDDMFRLSLPALERVQEYTSNLLIVSRRGAESFTYGRSILKESVIKIEPSLLRGQKVFILNESSECLGLAALSVDAYKIGRLELLHIGL